MFARIAGVGVVTARQHRDAGPRRDGARGPSSRAALSPEMRAVWASVESDSPV